MCHSLSVVLLSIVFDFTAVHSVFELRFAVSGPMLSRQAFKTEVCLFQCLWPFRDRKFFDFIQFSKWKISVIERASLISCLSIVSKSGVFWLIST